MKHFLALLAVLTLSVSPKVGFAPLKTVIKVHHPYEAGDRWLRIAVLCDEFVYTSSDRGLSASNPPLYTLSTTLDDACHYEVRVIVVKWDGSSTYRSQYVDAKE